MLILGIETSCDETAVALVEDGRKVIANIVSSQIAKHRNWGGVIPELASRMHLEVLPELLLEIFKQNELSPKDIDAVAVTQGPGLMGSLLVGTNVAKTFAWIHGKPIIPVNHLYGHICANFIDSNLEPPFLCLLASGGHTQIIEMSGYNDFKILGGTIDDAAGEAFDKVARLMDLPYPGGPEIDKLAQTFSGENKYKFTIAKVGGLDFSFSGLKTAVLRLKEKLSPEIWVSDRAEIAAAFQDCVAETLLRKIKLAIEQTNIQCIVIAGGVSANSKIRAVFVENFSQNLDLFQNRSEQGLRVPSCRSLLPVNEDSEDKRNAAMSDFGTSLVMPKLQYCTDNAAMIAGAAYFIKQSGIASSLNFEAFSTS